MKKTLQIIAYYLAPLAGLGILIIYPERFLLNYSGYIALGSLALVLLIHPLEILIPIKFMKRLMFMRREIGVLCFWAALLHGTGYLIRMNFDLKWGYLNPITWGYIALALLIILGITSNNLSIRIFGVHWKHIQRLSYVALPATLLHVELVKFKTFYLTLISISVYIALRIWTARIERKRLGN
jgi:DMSO/TMAO reductase YedYZ heme-binding membrane subunit